MKTIPIIPSDILKFMSFFDKKESGCWEWNRYLDYKGYGVFYTDKKQHHAHRVSYRYFVGEILEGMCICHKCDNRKCVNPDHLFMGTVQDNNKDRDKKGRNVSHSGDKHYTRKVGVTTKGSIHGMSKLTEKDVIDIRQRYFDGEHYRDIHKDYKRVHSTLIWQITRGKGWKHIAINSSKNT